MERNSTAKSLDGIDADLDGTLETVGIELVCKQLLRFCLLDHKLQQHGIAKEGQREVASAFGGAERNNLCSVRTGIGTAKLKKASSPGRAPRTVCTPSTVAP